MGGLIIWYDNNFMTESDIILELGFKQNITPKASHGELSTTYNYYFRHITYCYST
jgi:hypothetical protein